MDKKIIVIRRALLNDSPEGVSTLPAGKRLLADPPHPPYRVSAGSRKNFRTKISWVATKNILRCKYFFLHHLTYAYFSQKIRVET